MSDIPDWAVWILAIAVAGLFIWYFWHVGSGLFDYGRRVVRLVQEWPETRRAMVEAEAQAGGRYPLWYRAIRVSLIVAMVLLAVFVVWRKFAGSF